MASLPDIHAAIAGRLATIDGLSAFPYPPQGPRPPVAHVQLTSWEANAMGRTRPRQLAFEVWVFTAETVRPVDGYGLLAELADATGPKSVDLAIWDGNNPTAGTFSGTWSGTTRTCTNTQARVAEFRLFGEQELDTYQMYGGVFTVTVTTLN